MKLVAENPNNVLSSNFDSEDSREFGIKDPSFIIELLSSGFYSYPIRTLVQEYIANARDAVREAGRKTPLTIRIPTQFDSTFIVRDYGVGLSPERMNEVFLNYGSSTKRDTNGQIGGFGIGGKSALAYTDEFDIIAYFEGKKRHYNVFRACDEETGKDKVKLDLLLEEDTTEENGTEIIVAVNPSDIRKFQEAIIRATYFIDIRPNFIGMRDEEIPKIKSEDYFIISDRCRLVSKYSLPSHLELNYTNSKLVLLIDGVIYPVKADMIKENKLFSDIFKDIDRDSLLLYSVPNGKVKLSGSREEIKESKVTFRALDEISQEISEDVKTYLASSIVEGDSILERRERLRNLSKLMIIPNDFEGRTVGKYTLIGKNLHLSFDDVDALPSSLVRYCSDGKRQQTFGNSSFSFTANDNMDHLYYDDTDFSSSKLSRLYKWNIYWDSTSPCYKNNIVVVKNRGRAKYNFTVEVDKYRESTDELTPITILKTREYIPLTKQEFDEYAKEFNIKPLSSLNEPQKIKKQRNTSTSTWVKPENKVCLKKHYSYSPNKSSTWIDLSENKDIIIYIPTKKGEELIDIEVKKDIVEYLIESKGYIVADVSSSYISQLEGDENCIPYSKALISSLKLTEEEKEKVAIERFFDKKENINDIENILRYKLKYLPKLKKYDTLVREAVELYSKRGSYLTKVPKCLEHQLKDLSDGKYETIHSSIRKVINKEYGSIPYLSINDLKKISRHINRS